MLTEQLERSQAAGAVLKEQVESAQAAGAAGERDAAAAMAGSQAAAAVALEQALGEVEAERQLCQTLREELADMFEALGSAQEELTAADGRAFELEARFQASSLELVGAQQQLEQSLLSSRALNGQMDALAAEVAAQHLTEATQQEARLQQAQSDLEQARTDLGQAHRRAQRHWRRFSGGGNQDGDPADRFREADLPLGAGAGTGARAGGRGAAPAAGMP